jgi:hypothetical protein
MKKQLINEAFRLQALAGIEPINSLNEAIINFDELKKHQEIIRKEQDYLLDITEKLGVDNKLVSDFNKSLNDLMDAIFEKNK